jgi:23S rRNA (uracil1939-C5)-methyltransferase
VQLHDVRSGAYTTQTCSVHHPLINEAAATIRRLLRLPNAPPAYDEPSGRGSLRYVQLTVVDTEEDQRVQAVLVWNAVDRQAASGLPSFAADLWTSQQHQGGQALFHSVWATYHPAATNTILSDRFELLHGTGSAWITLAGDTPVCIDPPGSFMQANVGAMGAALAEMRKWVPHQAAVIDLHAGVGTIGMWKFWCSYSISDEQLSCMSLMKCIHCCCDTGLALAATHDLRALRLVEIVGAGKAAFHSSLQQLRDAGIHLQEAEYIVASAGSQPAEWMAGMDIAIVDPPRKGLDSELLTFLCSDGVPDSLHRLIYLSCGWKGFERDCTALTRSGRWKVRHAEGFVFFPGSDHLETLAVFDTL